MNNFNRLLSSYIFQFLIEKYYMIIIKKRIIEKLSAKNMYEAFLSAKAYERTYLNPVGKKIETIEIKK